METTGCSKIPNSSEDWKLNPNVECRIILNKLKIKTPESETMEFCRTLRNLSVPIEPGPTGSTTTTTDMHFKSEFVLDVLLNEILGKCEEKCKICEVYVQQLRHHIIQAHSGHPNPSPHPQTVTVFKCDICSSIYSSPSMLIRHRNTHSNNSDTLTTPCTNEPEPVRFDSNNIYGSIDISSVSTRDESVSSGEYEIHPQQTVPVAPKNVEWIFFKQEPSSSQSELEISNPNPPGILQHMNHLSTIENNLKQECDDFDCEEDLQDPLLLQDLALQFPSFVKYECTGISTESEHQTVSMAHDNNGSINTRTGGEQSQGRTCGQSFPVPSNLIKHKITHSGQKPHECDTCGKNFGKVHHLSRHKLIHTREKPHTCDACGKCFTLNSLLTRHRRTHTREKPFRCDVCGKRFSLGPHLASHKLTHTGERPHSCDVCGMCFASRSALQQHKLTHTGERPHKCDVCARRFTRRDALIRHQLTHTGEKPFRCHECGRRFALGTHLDLHLLTHTEEKPHKCDTCGRGFAQKYALIRHKQTHTGERPYKCEVCGKSFALGYNLANHKLTHTEERPHKCDVCGQGFNRSSQLTQHRLTHRENFFHCDECGQTYGQHEITKHKLNHAWQSTTTTLVNHMKEECESEEEGAQEDPLLNLGVLS